MRTKRMKPARRWALAAGLGLAALACNLPANLPFSPTKTPTPTTTATPTSTPTQLPTPTLAPTVLPAARLATAEQALLEGDYLRAAGEDEQALLGAPDFETQAAAHVELGRAQWLQGDLATALRTLREAVALYPGAAAEAEGYFFLGEVYNALQRYGEAAEAYGNYINLRPGVVDAYMSERQGDGLYAAGQVQAAVRAYQAALAAPQRRVSDGLYLKLARALAATGTEGIEQALAQYEALYQATSSDYTRAQVNLVRGQMLTALGQTEQAYAYYLDSVNRFPLAYDSYLALVELVNAGVAVDEYSRGLIDYYAGQTSLAIAAFDRYLQAPAGAEINPGRRASALYYKGLALRTLDAPEAAIIEWDKLVTAYDASAPNWDNAWEEIGYTQWAYLDLYPDAIDTFLRFQTQAPTHARAPEFLFFAGQVAERSSQLDRAAQIWQQLHTTYPTHPLAPRALFLAGIARYRLGQPAEALPLFQASASIGIDLLDRSAANFWIGKAYLALGDDNGARVAWENTATLDPTGYYSERARDLLRGRAPFEPPLMFDLGIDPQAERAQAEAWLRAEFALPADLDLASPGPLAADPRFVRGTEFWHLGLYEEARGEFEDLRLALQGNPAANYRLANHLLNLGLYRTAIFCARQVLTLAGMDDAATLTAPAYFNHVRFGTYFKELILPAVQENGLHPLLVFSLVRQESLFEGFVRSSAGARGLMQIIPSTGQEIAAQLGWPAGYTADDLYRPVINVPFGVAYLAKQQAAMGGDLYGALAAYNGGPGNAATWKRLSGDDPDLFLEVIRFEETRRYIRAIYEIFSIYRRIYDRTP